MEKGCVQYAEGLYVPGLDAMPQLAEDSFGFVGSNPALVMPFDVVRDVDPMVRTGRSWCRSSLGEIRKFWRSLFLLRF